MMSLFALILFGVVNLSMVLVRLFGKGRFHEFPFWAGMIALGWFYPQAIGGYGNLENYPPNAYADAMLFSTLCMISLWVGFEISVRSKTVKQTWIDADFNTSKLFYCAVVLCLFGFFFQWKLWSLPEEVLNQSQWTGAPVKYIFLASVFKMGFITAWLLYISQRRVLEPKLLLLIIPCMMMFLEAAVLRGRRAGMMDLIAYILVTLWFVKRKAIPRWAIIGGMALGLLLINAVGTYRAIMKNKDLTMGERLKEAAGADYVEESKSNMEESAAEFNNYVYYRLIHQEEKLYDYGLFHWNNFVFNYVPAQLVGKELKQSLMLDLNPDDISVFSLAQLRYRHKFLLGTTVTGFKDAFASFAWFGWIKFLIIGLMMGTLYRHAMHGAFLGQMLYVYFLAQAMQCVSHGTNDILVRVWVYFFALGLPVLFFAKLKPRVPKNPHQRLQ